MAEQDKDIMAMLKREAKTAASENTPTPPPSEQGMLVRLLKKYAMIG